jgi:hypothetical protein
MQDVHFNGHEGDLAAWIDETILKSVPPPADPRRDNISALIHPDSNLWSTEQNQDLADWNQVQVNQPRGQRTSATLRRSIPIQTRAVQPVVFGESNNASAGKPTPPASLRRRLPPSADLFIVQPK